MMLLERVDDERAVTIRDAVVGDLWPSGDDSRGWRVVGPGAGAGARAPQGEVFADHPSRADGIPDLPVVRPADGPPDLHRRLRPGCRLHPGAPATVGCEADWRKRHLPADDEEPWLQSHSQLHRHGRSER